MRFIVTSVLISSVVLFGTYVIGSSVVSANHNANGESGVSGNSVTSYDNGTVSVSNSGGTTNYNDWNGDGDYKDMNEQSYAGGGGGEGSEGGGGGYVPPCLTLPDLTVTSIGFATEPLPESDFYETGGWRIGGAADYSFDTVAADQLDPGTIYYPFAVIKNIGCMSTDAITITGTASGSGPRVNLVGGWGTGGTNNSNNVTGWYSYTSTIADDTTSPATTNTTGPTGWSGVVSGIISLLGGGAPRTDDTTTTTGGHPTLSDTQSTSTLYTNELPFGENGGFPIRLTVTFDPTVNLGGATVNPSTYINNHERLRPGESDVIAFSPVVLPEGTHTFEAYVDVPGTEDPGNGCNADAGCITEVPQDNNQYTVNAVVADPSITMGSSEYTGNTITYTETNSVHDIDGYTGEVALHWDGDKIQWGSCTGSTLASDGSTLSDFSGQRDGFNLTFRSRFGDRYDRNITEPATDTFHLYTMTCQSTGGTTVTASHIITNGADVDGLILTPDITNVHVDAGETVDTIPFTVTNGIGTSTADDATYTFTIDGTTVDTGTIDVPAGAVREPFTADVNWTAPAGSATYPMEVCVDHPDQIGAARCDEALLNVTDSLDTCQVVTARYNGGALQTKTYPASLNITHLVTTWTTSNSGSFVPGSYDEEVYKSRASGDGQGFGLYIDRTEPTEDKLDSGRPYIKAINGAQFVSMMGRDDQNRRPMEMTYENNCGGTINNPTISADPTLVRQGEETELTWDPAGNVGCYFSENVPGSFDSSGPGTGRVEIYRTSRFTITCPGTPTDLSASVTVQVIPTLFET